METHSSILAWRTSMNRSLAGYSPRVRKESGKAELLSTAQRLQILLILIIIA